MRRGTQRPELQGLGIGTSFRPIRTLTSAVTTAWGVEWDETYIARDLMQNFFDANRERLDEVRMTADGGNVRIDAPAAFNLERLFYLGSEKGAGDVGAYGEGFKVAATCLMRDHGVNPVAASGRDIVALRIADDAVRDTQLYPVEYDFFESDIATPGTVLILKGCSRKLTDAMAAGLTHFFHDRNPLLGERRWRSWDGSFAVYDSTDGRGHVFYRNLKRGEIDGIPAVLVIAKEYAALEKKIAKDRDRNAFNDAILKVFFGLFARHGLKGNSAGQRAVVEAARGWWPRGHALLSAIADSMRSWSGGSWKAGVTKEVFGDGYYAGSTSNKPEEQLQFEAVERAWRDAGRIRLPQYFAKFGVANARQHLADVREKALEESRRQNKRPPTRAEAAAVDVLDGVMRELAPEIAAVFGKRKTSYTVATTQALLGELKQGRGYRSSEVFLEAELFAADFAEALAVFLHEHAHIFGYDGDRGFTDALTELLETVVRERRGLDQYETAWEAARAVVARERKETRGRKEDALSEWLASKDEAGLRDLLRRVPAVVLRKVRDAE